MITKEDARNGWTEQSLAAYQRERERAFDRIGGNVVTEFKRPKAAIKIEGAGMSYNPLTRNFG